MLDPPTCDPPVQAAVTAHTTTASHVEELAERVRSQGKGKVVLVVGHSDTLPDLIREFGIDPAPTIEHLDYGKLFVLTLRKYHTTKLIKARYGQ
jgi:peptidyl-tRNA hydrolase